MNVEKKWRNEFPITRKYCYLDHAGIAPIPLRVRKAVDAFLRQSAESGAFSYGTWLAEIARVRARSAKLIGAEPEEIAFVKNTSHGLSLVAEGLSWKAGENMVVYEKEFPANLFPWLNLRRKGVDVRMLPSRDGAVSFDDIEQLIDSRTRLLAISSVQFQNGYRIDLQRLGELCAAKSVHLCVDAIQSLGAFPLDVKRQGIDFLAADGHKWLLSPEGIGIFYCRPELAAQLNPPLVGWKSVENEHDFDDPSFHLKKNAQRFEEGSLNVLGIIALGASLELLFEVGIDRIAERIQDLGDIIIREGEKRGFELKSPRNREDRGGIVSLGGSFDPLFVRDLLKERGIMVNVRGGALRLSPHFYNTEAEVLRCFQEVDDILATK